MRYGKYMAYDIFFIVVIIVLFILLFNLDKLPSWAGPVLLLLMTITVIFGIVIYVRRFREFKSEYKKEGVVVNKFWIYWLPVIYVVLRAISYLVLPVIYQGRIGNWIIGFLFSIVVGWFIDYRKSKEKK